MQRLKYLPLAVLLLAGCASLKQIPLFNNDAMLKNRIASGYEVLTEANNQVAQSVMAGLLTQDDVNKHWSPVLDGARKTIDEADALRIAGDTNGSTTKIEAAKNALTFIRTQLEIIKKGAK